MKNILHINKCFVMLLAGLLGFSETFAQTGSAALDGNNIKARFSADGNLFWDGKDAHFEAPKGSGKNTISAASLWIGGLDTKGDLHLSAQTYRESGSDFWPGPLDANGQITEAVSAQYNKIWKVTKLQIDSFRMNRGVAQAIMDWPQAAPYIDVDNNGLYEPMKGDYPDIKGDEMLWWVFNDNLRPHTETKGIALGLEIQASAYTFNCNDDILKNTVFVNYKIINRSKETYNNVYAGIWADFDIGNLFDDYVGSDSTLNTFYAYNADAFDNDTIIKSKSGNYAYKGYGKMLPVQSLTYLKGFKDDNNAEMNMSKFIYYNNDFAPTGNPTLPEQFYNLLRGYWLEQKSLTFGGDGYYGSETKANFAFPGDINNPAQWTEVSAQNPPGDRRAIGSFGPITLSPGETQELTAAFLYSEAGSGITNRASDVMRKQVSTLTNLYNSKALSPCTALSTCDNNNPTGCVWPGDADNDGKASAQDLFNIAYGFGEAGPKRSIVSTGWLPQNSADWTNNFPTGINYKYADADGNGIIDSADIMPLFFNLGETHGKDETGQQATNSDPTLRFDILEDSVAPGGIMNATLTLGSADIMAENVFGISGRISFEPAFLEAGTLSMDVTPSALGLAKELLIFQKYNFATGDLDWSIGRKTKSGTNINDIVIRWKYVIDPNVAGNKSHAKMENVKVVNANLEEIKVNTQGDEVQIKQSKVSIGKTYKNLSAAINLFPNPAQNIITVDLQNLRSGSFRVLSVQGKEMMRPVQLQGDNKISIPLNDFPQGIYMVEIITAEGRAIKKFSKIR